MSNFTYIISNLNFYERKVFNIYTFDKTIL